MRGQNFFFQYENQWYKIPFFSGKFPFLETNLEKVNYKDEFIWITLKNFVKI